MPASGKDVERVHVGRADDAEDVVHALRDQRFDERLGRRHSLYALGDGAVGLLHIGHRYPRLGDAAVLLYAGWHAERDCSLSRRRPAIGDSSILTAVCRRMSEDTQKIDIHRGLAGVYFERSRVCFIDGRAGELRYRGYSIHDLAEHSTFEETCYLLLNGELPGKEELARFDADLKAARKLPPEINRHH